jgi:CheY-like chemotaxis protein
MKILIVDDHLERHDKIKNKFNERDTIWYSAFNSDEGISLLQQKPDVVFLDHDLGERYSSRDMSFIDTTVPVAEEIIRLCKSNSSSIGLVIVHSMNIVGRNNLVNMLDPYVEVKGITYSALLRVTFSIG